MVHFPPVNASFDSSFSKATCTEMPQIMPIVQQAKSIAEPDKFYYF
jgi:hypothetical protein